MTIKIENSRVDSVMNKTKPIYKRLTWIIYTLYILIFFGLLSVNFKYLRYFSIIVQLIICVFLIIRFHPLRNHYYTKNDATMIFASAIFMLQNLGFTEIAIKYGEQLEKNVPFISKLHKDILIFVSYIKSLFTTQSTTISSKSTNTTTNNPILEKNE
jgi:hypothetical protein